MKTRYKYSEILLIAQTVAKEEIELFIFDPKGCVQFDMQSEVSATSPRKKVLINFAQSIESYKGMQLSDFDIMIDFSGEKKEVHQYHEEYAAIKNLSGELKWMKRANDHSSHFLHFLNTKTLTAQFKKAILRMAAYTRMLSLRSMKFSVSSKNKLWFKQGVSKFDKVVISFGAAGYMRKAVALVLKNDEPYKFLKIGLTEGGKYAVDREIRRMNSLTYHEFKTFATPKILKEKGDVLETSPIQANSNKKKSNTERALFRAIQEMSFHNQNTVKLSFTDFHEKIVDRLFWLRKNAPVHLMPYVKKAQHLMSNVNPNEYVKTALTHGDLTPWNIMCSDNEISIIDWEMCQKQGPLLYDAFHYALSKMTYVDGQFSLKSFNVKMDELLDQPKIKYIIKKHKLNVELYFALYLLHKSSEQLLYFSMNGQQTAKHLKWAKLYGQLMDEAVLHFQFEDQRSTLLELTEQYLKTLPYAAVKFQHNGFGEIPETSDLDIAINKKDSLKLTQYLKENLLVKQVKTQKLGHMTKLNVWLKDNQFLSIDAIHELSRKGVRFMDIDEVLRNRIQVNQHFRFSLADDYQYCQAFYTFNGADIDSKYQQVFENGFAAENLPLTIRHLQLLAGEDTKEAMSFTQDKQYQLKSFIKKYNRNPFAFIRRKIAYYQDFVRTALFHRGKVITFSGVDGAGKTTVIDIVSKRLKNKYRKDIVLLRHRPGVLPILSAIKHGSKAKAEQHASVTLPRQGKNKSKLSSMMRFCYYFLDYQIGQVYVYFKYVLRGKVVVYDRYYFDFINDAKRSNINLNRNFIKSLYRFIYKPDMNFYLFNDAETILARKAELSAQDINQMNAKYQDLFSEYQQRMKSNYIKVKNDDLNQTISLIMGELRKIA